MEQDEIWRERQKRPTDNGLLERGCQPSSSMREQDFSYEQLSLPRVDAILADMRRQPVPLSNMAAHYRAVEMFESVRWAKRAELSW